MKSFIVWKTEVRLWNLYLETNTLNIKMQINKNKKGDENRKNFLTLEIEIRTLHLPSTCCATELNSQPRIKLIVGCLCQSKMTYTHLNNFKLVWSFQLSKPGLRKAVNSKHKKSHMAPSDLLLFIFAILLHCGTILVTGPTVSNIYPYIHLTLNETQNEGKSR